jgi:hypothetical protein
MKLLYAVGDIHGQYQKLIAILQQAGLLDQALAWSGGEATLVFMGDFFDRGPNGLEVLNLVMRLQNEATAVGGRVEALLGNHEVMIMAAYHFGHSLPVDERRSFMGQWQRNGGLMRDLIGLEPEHISWMSSMPAIKLLENYLFIHADAIFYRFYGDSIESINQTLHALLRDSDIVAWNKLIIQFAERNAFIDTEGVIAQDFLHYLGGEKIIHGHTPISYVTDQSIKTVTTPLTYAQGLCVNLDGGMALGGPGFVHQLSVAGV